MHRKEIYTFMDGLTWLFQIIMFLCLGLLVNPHELLDIALVATLIGVFMIVIGRPLSVFLCLLPFGKKITNRSRLFVSWVGAYHLRHLSGSSASTGCRRDLQYRILYHDCFSRYPRYYRFLSCPLTETFYPVGKDR